MSKQCTAEGAGQDARTRAPGSYAPTRTVIVTLREILVYNCSCSINVIVHRVLLVLKPLLQNAQRNWTAITCF